MVKLKERYRLLRSSASAVKEDDWNVVTGTKRRRSSKEESETLVNNRFSPLEGNESMETEEVQTTRKKNYRHPLSILIMY